jgi:Replication protein A OB domain
MQSVADIEAQNVDTRVDFIGICVEKGSVIDDGDKTRRMITLMDALGKKIRLTLWRDNARNFNFNGNPIVLIRQSEIKEFRGVKNLSGGVVQVNPRHSEEYSPFIDSLIIRMFLKNYGE